MVTLVTEAWHMAKNLDPLIDSDDDEVTDYNTRIEYGMYLLMWYSRALLIIVAAKYVDWKFSQESVNNLRHPHEQRDRTLLLYAIVPHGQHAGFFKNIITRSE